MKVQNFGTTYVSAEKVHVDLTEEVLNKPLHNFINASHQFIRQCMATSFD